MFSFGIIILFLEGDVKILIPVPQFGLDMADWVILEQGFGWGYAVLVCSGQTPLLCLGFRVVTNLLHKLDLTNICS